MKVRHIVLGAQWRLIKTRLKGHKVAVIGCGPGGMFFLHALATKQRKLEETWSPSMETEFIDYKFKDHFGGSVPLYLP
jgi:hypothetical protein